MRYLFSIVALFLIINSADAQKKVNWMSWEDAMAAAETNPKKVYVDVYTDWCGYCKKMDNTTFKDPAVVKFLNDNFYPVKLNAEQKKSITFNETEFKYIVSGKSGVHELAYALLNGQLGYPAFVVLDEEFSRILISPGFKGADAVMMEMKFAAEEKYKTMQWNTYQNQYMAALNPQTATENEMVNTASPKVETKNTNVMSRSASANRDTIPQKRANKNAVTPPPPPPPPSSEEETFKVVEEMPMFPGCEEMEGSNSDKKKCADEKMLQFIYKNLKYPAEAKKNGVQGTVIVQYVVSKTGELKDIKILRDIGANCGEAAVDVVRLMPKWIPGKQRGRAVDVQFTLPVRFKLEKGDDTPNKPVTPAKGVNSSSSNKNDKQPTGKSSKVDKPSAMKKNGSTLEENLVRKTPPPPPPPSMEEEEVFKVVEQMPRFPGCEDMEGSQKDKSKCSEDKQVEFVYNNLTYPKLARENGIEGMVVLQFIVDKTGTLRDFNIVREIGAGCGDAALEVVKNMPQWIPGKQRGRAVNVLYTFPVRFKLEKEKPIKTEKRNKGN